MVIEQKGKKWLIAKGRVYVIGQIRKDVSSFLVFLLAYMRYFTVFPS